jgi:hypothetical protein
VGTLYNEERMYREKINEIDRKIAKGEMNAGRGSEEKNKWWAKILAAEERVRGIKSGGES